MKKFIFLVLLLVATMSGTFTVSSQEVIAVAGGGLFFGPELRGNFQFAEARIMFGRQIRVGPVFNTTWCYLQDQEYFYRGRNITPGLSFDHWAQGRYNRYIWLNAGYRQSYDRGATTQFYSWQRDNMLSLQAGLRLSRDIGERAWFGNNLLIVDAQFNLMPGEAIMRFSGESYKASTPYPKGLFRIAYEKGIKQIPLRRIKNSEVDFEPLAHIGYGYNSGDGRSHFEYGLGIGFGLFQDWYHDLFKVKAFMHQDLGNFTGFGVEDSQLNKPSYLQVEVTCNLLNFSFRKKESKKTEK